MSMMTGLSSNDIFCLAQKGYQTTDLIFGSSIYSLGLHSTIESDLKGVLGIEIPKLSQMMQKGRQFSLDRMMASTSIQNNFGVVDVNYKVIIYPGYVEFLSSGTVITNTQNTEKQFFSTSANGRDTFILLDAGYIPKCVSLGNVAYSTGVSGGLIGKIKSYSRLLK